MAAKNGKGRAGGLGDGTAQSVPGSTESMAKFSKLLMFTGRAVYRHHLTVLAAGRCCFEYAHLAEAGARRRVANKEFHAALDAYRHL